MCNCPSDHDLSRSIDDAIDRDRWLISGVAVGPPDELKWLYTIGLAERFAHAELLVVGVCCGPCGAGILNSVGDLVACGHRLEAPTVEPLEIRGGWVHLRPVPPICWESGWFAVWTSYYGAKPYAPPTPEALQVVYADRHGRFPWEPGCEPAVAAWQQLSDAPPPPGKRMPFSRRVRKPTRAAGVGPMRRARLVFPKVEPPAVLDDSWWMPLIMFFARLKDEGSCDMWLPDWDWREFMVMHGVERRPKPFIIEYKHVDTRRHVHVDRSGWAYRFVAAGGEFGRYDRHKRLSDAFWQLDPMFMHEVRQSRVELDVTEDDRDEPDTSSDWLASPEPPSGPYETWEPEPSPPRRPRKPRLKVVE